MSNYDTDNVRRIAELEAHLAAIRYTVDRQAEDPGLWFVAERATEGYLQLALRTLHSVVESAVPIEPLNEDPPTPTTKEPR